MKDPSCIAFLNSLWRAFWLAVPTFSGVIIGSLEFWRFVIVYLLVLVGQVPDPHPIMLGAFIFLGFSLVVYLGFVGIYVLLLRLLWKEPPKWLKFRNLGSIFLGFGITTVSALPAALTFPPFLMAIGKKYPVVETFRLTGLGFEQILEKMFLIWFLCAGSLYYTEYLWRNKQPSAKTVKTTINRNP
jgi:hypothetical protein